MRLAGAGPWVLRELDLRVLPEGSNPIRILHISDIHFAPWQNKKAAWLKSLANLKPDLVVNTGDNLGHKNAINFALQALEPLLEFPGVFVNGSNDYHSPSFRNPLNYVFRPSEPKLIRDLDTARFTSELESAGWQNLNNSAAALKLNNLKVGFLGFDDPHENLDQVETLEAQLEETSDADFRIGVAHAPYLRIIESFTKSGAELIFAGHTHGGQICLPGERSLTTNCDLPTRYAKGLSAWEYEGKSAMLHVSAGIGTSIWAPVRIFCPAEASLLTLLAKS